MMSVGAVLSTPVIDGDTVYFGSWDGQVHAIGWAYGPVLADLDNDGWLDLYATAGHMSRDRAKPDG